MMKDISLFSILLVLILFFAFYYLVPVRVIEGSEIYLTASTFLFAIFAGFFISRQSRRYVELRQNISRFDGSLSFVYRGFEHFDVTFREKVGDIIKSHYKVIIEQESWNYHLMNASTTLSSIHKVMDKSLSEVKYKTLQSNVLNRIMAALLDAQIARKDMISLYYERIPKTKWFIIYFLTIVLLLSLFSIASDFLFFESLLKASFATIIVFIVVLLHQLNNLILFEHVIGENSAHDVLKILSLHDSDIQ